MREFWAQLFAFVFLPLYFGGSSSSASSTQTTYNTRDERIAAAEGAIVTRTELDRSDVAGGSLIKFTGNNNVIESTDRAVVQAAFEYAKNRDALAGETLGNVLKSTSALYTMANDAFQISQSAPQGQFTERTILLIGAGVAVIALVFVMRKK
jgi:hypothetical protein